MPAQWKYTSDKQATPSVLCEDCKASDAMDKLAEIAERYWEKGRYYLQNDAEQKIGSVIATDYQLIIVWNAPYHRRMTANDRLPTLSIRMPSRD